MRFAVGLSAFLACVTAAGVVRAADPVGYLDAAGCDVAVGWAQDPDIPNSPIAVHIYWGGPAGSGAPASVTEANVHRDDLCTAIGSCEHGFVGTSPLSLHDGAPHDVYAYGINDNGGNPQLTNVRQLACTPEPASGVRRRVSDLPSLEAWRFQGFWDQVPLGEWASPLADGPDLPEAPRLVRGDDGAPEVWLVDAGGHLKRPITAEVALAWRFDLEGVEEVDAGRLGDVIEGTPLRARPVVFIDGAVYAVDDPQPDASSGPSLDPESVAPGGGGAGDGGAGGAGGEAGAGGGVTSSDDGCSTSGAPSSSWGSWLLLLGLALVQMPRARRYRAITGKSRPS